MQHSEMLSLITSSGLTIQYAFEHTRRYGISMCINGRYQNDVLTFEGDVFVALTTQEAQRIIDASKVDMLRASNTKSGKLKNDIKEKSDDKKTVVKRVKKEDSDIEKYLKKMRARGNRLAKSVRYG